MTRIRSLERSYVFKRVMYLLIVIDVLLISVSGSIAIFRYTMIQSVSCTFVNDGSACYDVVLAEFNRIKGQSLLIVNTSPIEKKVLAGLPEIESIETQKHFPNELRVVLHRSDLVLTFMNPDSSLLLVNRNGHIVTKTSDQSTTLPRFQLESANFTVGDTVNTGELPALLLLIERIKTLPIQTATYRSSDEILLHLDTGKTIVLSTDRMQEELNTLQLLLNEATMIQKATVVDLRFSHPVLKEH